jgi:hypothetical protein
MGLIRLSLNSPLLDLERPRRAPISRRETAAKDRTNRRKTTPDLQPQVMGRAARSYVPSNPMQVNPVAVLMPMETPHHPMARQRVETEHPQVTDQV